MDELEGTADAACDVLLNFVELGAPAAVVEPDVACRLALLGERLAGQVHHPLLHARFYTHELVLYLLLALREQLDLDLPREVGYFAVEDLY